MSNSYLIWTENSGNNTDIYRSGMDGTIGELLRTKIATVNGEYVNTIAIDYDSK